MLELSKLLEPQSWRRGEQRDSAEPLERKQVEAGAFSVRTAPVCLLAK